MGVPGDEDGGGMSAFVAFSMLGFYPVTPGLPMYVIGSPWFEEASVDSSSAPFASSGFLCIALLLSRGLSRCSVPVAFPRYAEPRD